MRADFVTEWGDNRLSDKFFRMTPFIWPRQPPWSPSSYKEGEGFEGELMGKGVVIN